MMVNSNKSTKHSPLLRLGFTGDEPLGTTLARARQGYPVHILSPSWFALASSEGKLTDLSSPAYTMDLLEAGVTLTPLVHNQFDPELTSAFLAAPEARHAFIHALVSRLQQLDLHSLNLDFEMMHGRDRANYTAFVTELCNKCTQLHIAVTIDLPQTVAAWEHLTPYDHQELKHLASQLLLMAYDEHYAGDQVAGPVAGLRWTQRAVHCWLRDYAIDPHKMLLGIPFYTRLWELDQQGNIAGSRAIMQSAIPNLLRRQRYHRLYDSKARQYRYVYRAHSNTYMFWHESIDVIKARMALARREKLAGVGFWRYGFESPKVWKKLKAY